MHRCSVSTAHACAAVQRTNPRQIERSEIVAGLGSVVASPALHARHADPDRKRNRPRPVAFRLRLTIDHPQVTFSCASHEDLSSDPRITVSTIPSISTYQEESTCKAHSTQAALSTMQEKSDAMTSLSWSL